MPLVCPHLTTVSLNVKLHNRYYHNWHNSVSSVIEFFFKTSISLILGEAEGHVVLFETVVPICPPACDGYNYSSKGSSGLQVGMAFLFVPILTVLSLYIFNLKLKRWNNTQIEKRNIFKNNPCFRIILIFCLFHGLIYYNR